jgi:altronate dehydratase
MSEDMDVNCGSVIKGEVSIKEMGKVIFKLILEIASGKKTKSETQNYGDCEFIPWQPSGIVT